MKRFFLGVAGGLILVAAPAHAEERSEELTILADLDCVIALTFSINTIQEKEGNPQGLLGLMTGLGYFIGRYEKAGGRGLASNVSSRSRMLSLQELNSLLPRCLGRMNTVLGQLEKIGQEAPELRQ